MTSSGSVLLAKPAFRSVPRAASSAGPEAIELAASAGLDLDGWQQQSVTDVLGEDGDGYWAATSSGLIVPRQNGKGSIIEALELAWLFLFGVELIFHSAHLFATAQDAYRRIKSLIVNTPDLHRQVLKYSEAHGQEGIELRSGQRLRFVARSKSGGRGFPAPVVVLDEAFNLSSQAMQAMVPTMAAQDNPFLLLASSAPIEDPCSDVLRGFMRDSRTGLGRRCYIEYSADPDTDEATQLRQANPGYGIRLNDDVIDEERRLLTPEAFKIERLGIVDLTEGEASRVIPRVDWDACEYPESKPLAPLSFAVDVSEDRATTSIGVAGLRADGRVHLEVIESRPGASWVVDRLAAILRKAKVDKVTLCPGAPAGGLLNDLGLAGITVNECSAQESAQACGAFFDGIMDRRYLHIGQPVLTFAVDGAEKRKAGDAWVWDRRSSSTDITPLVSVTLAAWALHSYAAPVDVADNIW